MKNVVKVVAFFAFLFAVSSFTETKNNETDPTVKTPSEKTQEKKDPNTIDEDYLEPRVKRGVSASNGGNVG